MAAPTLAEAQKRQQNPLLLAIIQTFIAEWPILRNAVVAPINGNALTFNREGTLPAPAFRAVNGTVADSSQVVASTTVSLKILASHLKLDQFLDATAPTMAAQELSAQIKAIALDGNKAVFKGSATSNPLECDGLQVQTTALGTVIANNGASGALSLAKLRELVLKTKGTNKALYMNEGLFLRFQSAADDPTITNISRTTDQYGLTIPVFDGVPVYMAGEDSTGAQVLPFTEGTNTDESSIYCVAHGDGFRFLTNTNPAGDTVDTLGVRTRQKPGSFGKEWEFEWYFAPTILEKKGVYRLSGVKDLPAVKA